MAWFYYTQSGKQGPYSVAELKALAANGTLGPEMVVENGQGQQALAGSVGGLLFPTGSAAAAVESIPIPAAPSPSTVQPTLPEAPQPVFSAAPDAASNGFNGQFPALPQSCSPENSVSGPDSGSGMGGNGSRPSICSGTLTSPD